METLRAAFAKLGFLNIDTYLTSGNVIFDTSPVGVIGPLEAQISRHLNKVLDTHGVTAFVRTPRELSDIASRNPFDAAELKSGGNLLFVVFLSEPPDERTERQLRIRRNHVDELRLSGREIFWLRRPSKETVSPPDLAEILDAPATVRSLTTIERLIDKCMGRAATSKPVEISTESARSHP
jgi:uncharacterized protein (DUF1697 family)